MCVDVCVGVWVFVCRNVCILCAGGQFNDCNEKDVHMLMLDVG